MLDYNRIILEYLETACERMYAEPKGDFKHRCLLPVAEYSQQLWDWGSWTSNIAVRQIMTNNHRENKLFEYEKGCRLNFFDNQSVDGKIPICIATDVRYRLETYFKGENPHKPVMAQHCAFIVKYNHETEWLVDSMMKLDKFIRYYETNYKHESGLFFFADDFAIGVDNDPSTFFRPNGSSASIYLNSLMYKEFDAMAYLYEKMNDKENCLKYKQKAEELKATIIEYCWDEKDGMFYSCDINLNSLPKSGALHSGCPRHYSTLIQRIGCWSSFMPMWSGIATPEQVERMVKENLLDKNGFNAPYGVRSLSKYEKMYRILPSGNPSCWLGPIWGVSNYMVFRGLLKYGYIKLAKELCDKTILLFGKDVEENNAFHEYYDPETGKGVYNKDFLSWNMLVANMIAWQENREVISEF